MRTGKEQNDRRAADRFPIEREVRYKVLSRKDNADARCPRCRVHTSLCVCALIPRIATRTRLLLVIHRREERKPTNTGRLAIECLSNSQVLVRGHQRSPGAPFTWGAAYASMPSGHATTAFSVLAFSP